MPSVPVCTNERAAAIRARASGQVSLIGPGVPDLVPDHAEEPAGVLNRLNQPVRRRCARVERLRMTCAWTAAHDVLEDSSAFSAAKNPTADMASHTFGYVSGMLTIIIVVILVLLVLGAFGYIRR